MKSHVFLYSNGDSKYLRAYILGFPDYSEPERGLVLDMAVTPNLNRPAEIIFSKISKRIEQSVREGKPHMFFGEIKDNGYIGTIEFQKQTLQEILEYEGRTIDGWERIYDIISRAVETGKDIETIRPGMRAEKAMSELYKDLLE